MIAALEVPSDINLALFSSYLHQQGITHRISEQGVNQIVWVADPGHQALVIELYSRVNSGELVLKDESGRQTTGSSVSRRLAANLFRFPLTMLILGANILLAPVGITGNLEGLFHQMTLLQFEVIDRGLFFEPLQLSLASGQWWRLLSPMFLHFSWLHIVFNLLWVWEIGRRIELIGGSSTLLLVTLVSSLFANVLQYTMSGPGLFGGMSGVVFGYLGYCFVWDKIVPTRSTGLRPAIYIFMFVFLVVGFTGMFDLLGLGSLANGAHLGGLIGGLVTGAIAALLSRLIPDRR